MGLLHKHDLLTPHEQWEQLCHTFMYNYKTVKGLVPANHTFLTAMKQGPQIRSSWSTDSLSSNLAENYIQNDRSYRLWHCNTDCLEPLRQHYSPFWQYWMLLNWPSADRPAPLLHTPTRITNARFLDASDIYYSNRNREMLMLIVMLAVALQELSPQYVPAQPLRSLQPHLRIPSTVLPIKTVWFSSLFQLCSQALECPTTIWHNQGILPCVFLSITIFYSRTPPPHSPLQRTKNSSYWSHALQNWTWWWWWCYLLVLLRCFSVEQQKTDENNSPKNQLYPPYQERVLKMAWNKSVTFSPVTTFTEVPVAICFGF